MYFSLFPFLVKFVCMCVFCVCMYVCCFIDNNTEAITKVNFCCVAVVWSTILAK
jgi:hypothetical protein